MSKMSTVSGATFVVSIFAFFVSCATYKPFIAPGFNGAELTKGGLAVFPVLVGEGSASAAGIESYLRVAGEELANSMRKDNPSLKLLGPSEVTAALAKNNLVGDFATFKQSYSMTGMADTEIAKKLLEPFNTRYFVLASITSLYAKDNSTAACKMVAKVFDSQQGQVVFESLRDGESTSILGGPPYALRGRFFS